MLPGTGSARAARARHFLLAIMSWSRASDGAGAARFGNPHELIIAKLARGELASPIPFQFQMLF
jgi:hypothetical protein